MKVVERLEDCAGLPFPVVTIGNFDGVHLGHQAVLKLLRERAALHHGTVLALTFDPHPLRVLAPDVVLKFLTDPEEKLRLLGEAGVDVVVRLPFTREFAAQTPGEFMERILAKGLGARELYVGENFRFGKGRQGTIETLREAAPRLGFTVTAIAPIVIHGHPVSSTRIRDLVQEGAVAEATALLGRPYTLRGRVVKGEGRGEGLGFPTANLLPPEGRVLPADGVYAADVSVGLDHFPAATYVGARPTYGTGPRLIESHLLDGGRELYDQDIAVAFHERLREDRVFESPDLLARQITEDVDRARSILRRVPRAAAPAALR